MIDTDIRRYTNQKCLIEIDADGNKLAKPILTQYFLMEIDGEHIDVYSMPYLGYGKLHSCFDKDLGIEIKLSGYGHFWSK
jgi:hypothetical protein